MTGKSTNACEHKSAYQCANCELVFCMYCDAEQPLDREIKTIGSKFCPACEACPEDA